MTKLSAQQSRNRPAAGVRVFADDAGRLWSVAQTGGVLVFNCVGETRHSSRALAMELTRLDDSISDDDLRGWLDQAPRIGTLL